MNLSFNQAEAGTRPKKWSHNEFLSNNEALLIPESCDKSWSYPMIGVQKMLIEEKIIEKYGCSVVPGLHIRFYDQHSNTESKNEKTDKYLWRYIEDAQQLELIRERKFKLKRKVDMCSVEILDKSTSEQDLHLNSQEGRYYDNKKVRMGAPLQGTEESTQFIKNIRGEIRKETRNIGIILNWDISFFTAFAFQNILLS
ncbi:6569_t:CDS:2 [Funneliformis caledonium]|uniref:6569_t:CDS:1 n=1 Tax=Funneliformis caledonium TaxID=1117310 RepID=A0A9N9CDD9_9GLOM|nr:6569_t:CDS:2 [Funneliformis caledonium]